MISFVMNSSCMFSRYFAVPMIMKSVLTRIIFLTLLFSLVAALSGTALYTATLDRTKSEMPGLVYGVSAAIILLFSLASFCIYLNLIPKIRHSLFYCLLSFFALPVLTALFLFTTPLLSEEIFLCMVTCIPFFGMLAYQFFRFKKMLAQ